MTTSDSDPLVLRGTPWETHQTPGGREVWVKREDLCARIGPPFSKMRGLVDFLRVRQEERFGALDSYHSQAGWALACACRALGRRAVVFYPEVKGEPGPRKSQQNAAAEGAEVIPLVAGRSAILWFRARRRLALIDPAALLLPNGLVLAESVAASAAEVIEHTPAALFAPSVAWVVSVSSGTIAAGVARGLTRAGFRGRLVLHLGYSRSESRLRSDLALRAFGDALFAFPFSVEVIDEGYAYRDRVEEPAPFPSNEYYDRKAWRWIASDPPALSGAAGVAFWNIGD